MFQRNMSDFFLFIDHITFLLVLIDGFHKRNRQNFQKKPYEPDLKNRFQISIKNGKESLGKKSKNSVSFQIQCSTINKG